MLKITGDYQKSERLTILLSKTRHKKFINEEGPKLQKNKRAP
jgi:hypothetical protein